MYSTALKYYITRDTVGENTPVRERFRFWAQESVYRELLNTHWHLTDVKA